MGFHKRHIPELAKLKEIRNSCNDDKEFLDRVVGRADAFIGSRESMQYLDQVYEEIKKREEGHEN
jgi:hypothetical protein